MKIKIYGASDDLIECDGEVPGCDEFYGDNGLVVLAPTGDRFRVKYGEGHRAVWSVTHEHDSGKLQVSIVKAPPGDDPDPYTDTVMIIGEIQSVSFWKKWPPTSGEIRRRTEKALEDLGDIDDATIARVWEALGSP